MRGFIIGLLLIFIGVLVMVIGPLLASLAGGKSSGVFVVWIFPLPPLVFGNATSIKTAASILGIPPAILIALGVLFYGLLLAILVLIVLEIIHGVKRARRSVESPT